MCNYVLKCSIVIWKQGCTYNTYTDIYHTYIDSVVPRGGGNYPGSWPLRGSEIFRKQNFRQWISVSLSMGPQSTRDGLRGPGKIIHPGAHLGSQRPRLLLILLKSRILQCHDLTTDDTCCEKERSESSVAPKFLTLSLGIWIIPRIFTGNKF